MIAKLDYPQVGLFVIAWLATDLLTPLVILLCHRIGALDRPHSYKIHQNPIPFLGGVGLFLGFGMALFSILRFSNFAENSEIFSILIAGFVVLVMGCVDGFRPIWAVAKLGVLLIITLILAGFGVQIRLSGIPAVDIGLTLLWVSGISSAMNSLDNMDGAATGVAGIAAMWTFYIAWYGERYGQPEVSFVAAALFGACVGFLRYNFKPARVFLGDNGSLVLGFVLASLTILTGWSRTDPMKAVIVPCAILCVPLYDITLSTVLRIKQGVVTGPVQAIVYCGRDHLAHRLVALGFSQREAVLVMYLFGMMSGTVGVIVARQEVTAPIYIPVTLASMVVLVILGLVLDRAKVYPHQLTAPPETTEGPGSPGNPS